MTIGGLGWARFVRAMLVVGLVLFTRESLAQYVCPAQLSATPPPGITLLNIPAAWQRTCGTAYVGHVDNGIDASNGIHPQLAPSVRTRFSRHFLDQETLATIQNLDEEDAGGGARGHGTHGAGIIAARPGQNSAVGTCPDCSLMVIAGQHTTARPIVFGYESGAQVLNLSTGSDQTGAPALPSGACAWIHDSTGFSGTYDQSYCDALDEAIRRDVVVVAASGNAQEPTINFPASRANVIAVGGTLSDGSFWNGHTVWFDATHSEPLGSSSGSQQWVAAPAFNVPSTFYRGATWVKYLTVSPGQAGDDLNNCEEIGANSGFGHCTGTSMSAPYVSAIVGLMRSANPYLTIGDVRTILSHRSSNNSSWNPMTGYGFPNAADAVTAALAGDTSSQPISVDAPVLNRTVPLLAMYSAPGADHFYTVVPQMALAANRGTMPPRPLVSFHADSGFITQFSYQCQCVSGLENIPVPSNLRTTDVSGASVGNVSVRADLFAVASDGTLSPRDNSYVTSDGSGNILSVGLALTFGQQKNYLIKLSTVVPQPLAYTFVGSSAPGIAIAGCSPGEACMSPKAIASVFTTHANPVDGSQLAPLYRMSWKCGEGPASSQGACASNPAHVSHAYTTDPNGIGVFQGLGYVLDGIEGFVFPKTQSPQPPGTVRLCRRYSTARDDYILFAGAGANGGDCTNVNDSQTGGVYDITTGNTDWIAYVYPVGVPQVVSGPPVRQNVSITISGAPANAVVGQTITLSASVSITTVTGQIQFFDNGVSIGVVNASAGSASLSRTLAVGTHSFTATYLGDSNYNPATSSAITTTVARQGVSVTISAPASATLGQTITVSASVSFTTVTGQIQFFDNGGSIGVVNVSGGSASLARTLMATGTHSFTATYSGDANFNPATSAAVTTTVGKATPSASVSSSLSTTTTGQFVTFTSTVSGIAGIPPGGSVMFLYGTTVIPGCVSVPLAGGVAKCMTNAIPLGTYTITAQYSGDGNYNSAIPTTTQIVQAAGRISNVSTRANVQPGNDLMIGGFIIDGPSAKTVIVRAIGPSLAAFGLQGVLSNPILTVLRSSDNTVIAQNDNWQTPPANGSQVSATGLAPSNPLESAVVLTLNPGAYTAFVQGVSGVTGLANFEVFEVNHPETPFTNFSTRGEVMAGNNVMIGGFIVSDAPVTVVLRGVGPSLAPYGITDAAQDPTLTVVRSSDQAVIASNDDWQSAGSDSVAQVSATGFAPTDPHESAVVLTLQPGAYTAIIAPKVGTAPGVGMVQLFVVH